MAVSVRSIRRYAEDGLLDPVRIGRNVRYRRADVERLISRDPDRDRAGDQPNQRAVHGRLADDAREVGKDYEGQIAAKDETIATQREVVATQPERVAEQQATIAELRRRAAVAEAELARQREEEEELRALMRARQAARPTSEAPHGAGGQGADVQAPDASGDCLARVRRFFGGGEG